MYTKQDVALANNLLKLLAKAKIELEGLEVFAAADAMKWYSNLVKTIETEASTPPPAPKQDKIEEVKEPEKKPLKKR